MLSVTWPTSWCRWWRGHRSADIPGFQTSSGGGRDVCPGGVFVIGGVGLQAAVQDADEAIGELVERGLMTDLAGAELLVVGLAPGDPRIEQNAHCCSASPSRRLRV